jgi:sulfate/thiosulfate transport system ATP-binding protein
MSIEIRHVTKHFGTFRAVDDVTFRVPTGELVALLGPSGSGKTSLLRIIAGLERPDSGAVHFHEDDVTRRAARERNVGFVFQHYALFQHLTVFENIAFGLRVRGIRRAETEARVGELLELVQLAAYGRHYPAALSGGQRQRVALARALAPRPKLLLLDEPFGALDAKVRRELREWLRRLHDEIRTTSVFVTHDQDEAFSLADRVVLMNEGRIQQIGPPRDIVRTPANAFVRDFIGGFPPPRNAPELWLATSHPETGATRRAERTIS